MDQPKRAVLIMEEDSLVPAHCKPLMLETVLFCPILTWMGNRCGLTACSGFCCLRPPFRRGGQGLFSGGSGCDGV